MRCSISPNRAPVTPGHAQSRKAQRGINCFGRAGMTLPRSQSSSIVTAMLGAGAVTAQFVGGKATRDALFLASLGFTALPTMVIATSAVSIILLIVSSKNAYKISPATLVPAAFAASGVLLLLEWWLTYKAAVAWRHRRLSAHLRPRPASRFLVLADRERAVRPPHGQEVPRPDRRRRHAWRAPERTSRRTGRGRVRRRGHAPVPRGVSLFQRVASAAARRRIRSGRKGDRHGAGPCRPTLSGWRVMAEAPYLQGLATLVLLGATGAALVDYLFKVEAVKVFGRGDTLLRFFAIYYAATSVMAFVIQTSASRADAGAVRACTVDQHPFICAAWRRHWRSDRSRSREPDRRTRRGIGASQLAVSGRLRVVLHANPGRGKARREGDRGRRGGATGRCARRRPGPGCAPGRARLSGTG